VCFIPPTTALDVNSDADLDTDASPLCDPTTSNMCVIPYKNVTIEGGHTLRAHGSRPLAIVSLADVNITGTIDVSSRRNSPGAGANPRACNLAPATKTGGAGGSFAGVGGSGGPPGTLSGVSPALPPISSPPMVLRGGCQGQSGASAQAASGAGGAGGAGGGALGIIASNIKIDGHINASGAGGQGGPAHGQTGAGGGGSGGMIVLDASPSDAVILEGRVQLWANGGGGGQGGTTQLAGEDGAISTAPGLGAHGTASSLSSSSGADGGAGSVGVNLAGQDAIHDGRLGGGGGGGGGGAGWIIGVTMNDPTEVSPPAR